MYGYFVTGQDLNEIHSELAGNVCQNGVTVANVNSEHCIRQRIYNDALNLDYVVFCQVMNLQWLLLCMSRRTGVLRNSFEHFAAAVSQRLWSQAKDLLYIPKFIALRLSRSGRHFPIGNADTRGCEPSKSFGDGEYFRLAVGDEYSIFIMG